MSKKPGNQTQKRSISTKLLVKKALNNGPVWKPSKGYKYLKDLAPGSGFRTSSGMAGILIECNTNAKVIIGHVPQMPDDDKQYYLGRKIIAANTEVKEVK